MQTGYSLPACRQAGMAKAICGIYRYLKTKSTKSHRPFDKLSIITTVSSRIEARKLEKYYKSGIGRETLKQRGIA